MKLSMLFILLTTVFIHPTCYSQTFAEEDMDTALENHISREEGDMQSELNPIVSDEVEHPEIERQEEPLYPEGEENDWSLGGEDLPAEEYE